MKKYRVPLLLLLMLLCLYGCSSNNDAVDKIELDNEKIQFTDNEYDREQTSKEYEKAAQPTEKNHEQQEKNIEWKEISEDGINEDLFFQNIDIEVLKDIALEFQALTDKIILMQMENPDSVLEGKWIDDIIESEQYNKVISMGETAAKPLYWIIYKSPSEGLYEYICALALEKISGYDFDEDGDGVKWSTSKEFLYYLNIKILNQE